MIELDIENYKKIVPIIRSADINVMFALSVLERKVRGKIFVDDKSSPTSFYIEHPYGMTLLYGETNRESFYLKLVSHMLNLENTRNDFEWLQVYPVSLYSKIDDILGKNLIKKNPNVPYNDSFLPEEDKKVLEYQRINFVFNQEKYLAFKRNLANIDYKIVPISETIFYESDGSVIPRNFWNNFSDFNKNGKGFTLLENNVPVSTSFSSFVIDNKLEIGIETNKKEQGSGFGSIVCAELIDYCIVNGYEPIWSCSSGNIGSKKLAQKLGFEELKRVPYYRLSR